MMRAELGVSLDLDLLFPFTGDPQESTSLTWHTSGGPCLPQDALCGHRCGAVSHQAARLIASPSISTLSENNRF